MQRIKDIKAVGIGGMNLDTSHDLLKPEDTRERYNCRSIITDDGNSGIISNLKSNKQIESNLLITGDSVVIGKVPDYRNDAIIYFVANKSTTTKSQIIRYYPKTDNIELILQHGILNFMVSNPIIHANIVGDMLYWTDDYEYSGWPFSHQNYNPPRKLNINKAKAYSSNIPGTIYTRYFPNNDDTWDKWFALLDRIKYPPWKGPEFVDDDTYNRGYGSDQNYQFNDLRNKLFQFRYRFVYDDNEMSVWSPISKASLPQNEETATGRSVENIHLNNCIAIELFTGQDHVLKIEIAAREGNNGLWKLIDRLFKYDEDGSELIASNTTLQYVFYNKSIGELLPIESVNRPFDYVPQISRCQEVIQENRLVDINFIEGYDNVDVNVELTPVYYYRDYTQFQYEILMESVHAGPWINPGGSGGSYWFNGKKFTIPDFVEGSTMTITIDFEDPWYEGDEFTTHIITYVTKPGDTKSIVCDELIEAILAEFGNIRVDKIKDPQGRMPYIACREAYDADFPCDWPYQEDAFYLFIREVKNDNMDFTYQMVIQQNICIFPFTKYPTFKSDRTQEFGIVYYDRANRSGAVNESAGCKVLIPDIVTQLDNKYGLGLNQCLINWEIKNRPPEWATHYQWVMVRKNPFCKQFYINSIQENHENNTMEIELNTAIQDYIDDYFNCMIEPYEYKRGDRIRFLATWEVESGVFPSVDMFYILPNNTRGQLDFEIIGQIYPGTDDDYERDHSSVNDYIYDERGNKVLKKSSIKIIVPYFNKVIYPREGHVLPTSIGPKTLVEIYSPVKNLSDEDTRIFYEFGEVYEVGNPHTNIRYHKKGDGDLKWCRDQDSEHPEVGARGQFLDGDAYLRLRVTRTLVFPVEDQSYSDFYESEIISIGRINAINRDMRRNRIETGYRYSGLYIQQTQINDLSSYEYDSFGVLPDKYGPVNRIIEDRLTLVCRHPYKTHSIYIGRSGLKQAEMSGLEVVVTNDKVLSTVFPWKDNYGSSHPEADIFTGKYFYFVDINNGVIMRQADNGNIPISQHYGLNKWTKEICKEIRENSSYNKIIAGFDKKHDEVYFSFFYTDFSGTNHHETVVWNELANRWTHFITLNKGVSYPLDNFATIGDYFITFINGELWKQEAGDDYGSMFGNLVELKLKLIANIYPKHDKTFKTIILDTNGQWWSGQGEVLTYESAGRREMQSELRLNRFKDIHGVKYANFMRAGNTKTLDYEIHDLFNGNEMRGNVIEITLRNNEQTNVVLSLVTIESLSTELTG